MPLDLYNKEGETFLRIGLDQHLFQVSDRVSINQFLSLFNVFGPENGRRLDKFINILKNKVEVEKQKGILQHEVMPEYHREKGMLDEDPTSEEQR